MAKHQTFEDEDLTAYIDGEADAELANAVELALKGDGQLQLRLNQLSFNTRDLKFAYDQIAAPAAPNFEELSPLRPVQFSNSKSWRSAAAAAIAALAVGWGTFTYFEEPKPETWQQLAADYHSLYVTNTLSEVSPQISESRAEVLRGAEAIGKPIRLDTLTNNTDLDFKRAQILGFHGRPLLQVAFLSKTGTPVVLCIIRADEDVNTSLKSDVMRGMSSVTWKKGHYDYLLIGGTDANLIERAAKSFSETL